MATLFIVCGLPGSGKSTLARRLEAEHGAVRLVADEWVHRILGEGYDEPGRAAVEGLQLELAGQLLARGLDGGRRHHARANGRDSRPGTTRERP